jgi:hypothetical protein
VLLGGRLVIPGDFETQAVCPAGGFLSTGSDLVKFFAQLSPSSKQSILSVASRREMVRGQWQNPLPGIEQRYGLGVTSGSLGGWEWFGHSGGLQGYISRTLVLPRQEITVTVLTNALDGWADSWIDGVVQILRAHSQHGAPADEVKDWLGRWWTLWGPYDLLPMGHKVIAISPTSLNPMLGAAEVEITGRDTGLLLSAVNYGSHGEPVRCIRDKSGKIVEISLAGTRLLPASTLASELRARYGEQVPCRIEPEPVAG